MIPIFTRDVWTRNRLWSSFHRYGCEGAKLYVNACSTGRGSFPQELANAFGSTVYAYDKEMKFFVYYQNRYGDFSMIWFYTGTSGEPNEVANVFMMPVVKSYIPWPLGPIEFKPGNKNPVPQ